MFIANDGDAVDCDLVKDVDQKPPTKFWGPYGRELEYVLNILAILIAGEDAVSTVCILGDRV